MFDARRKAVNIRDAVRMDPKPVRLDLPEDEEALAIPLLFGRYLVHRGYASEQELAAAVRVQAELRACAPALDIAAQLSREQLAAARALQRERAMTLREAVAALGLALADRESSPEPPPRIGEILLRRGVLTAARLEAALAEYRRRPPGEAS